MSKRRVRFFQILWLSQNIRTLLKILLEIVLMGKKTRLKLFMDFPVSSFLTKNNDNKETDQTCKIGSNWSKSSLKLGFVVLESVVGSGKHETLLDILKYNENFKQFITIRYKNKMFFKL